MFVTIKNKKLKPMKKYLKLAAVALITSVTLVSCGDDDDNNSSSTNPSIFLVNENEGFITSDVTLEPGASISFSIQANENTETKENLRNVKVYNSLGDDILDTSFNAQSFTFELTNDMAGADAGPALVAGAQGSITTYTFEVTDRKERKDTYVVSITAEGVAVEDGDIRDIDGPNTCLGSYDLVLGTALSSNSANANKDMSNVSGAGFDGKFTSKNGTTFKLMSAVTGGITYGSANTAASLETAYTNAGGAELTTVTPTAGQFYAVKLRGGSAYALISIQTVNNTDDSCSPGTANKGILAFEYKINRD